MAAPSSCLLAAVPGYASSLTYHPNGLLDQVAHANGVTDSQERAPNDMGRPLRLRTSGASENFDLGLYAFDGAGNVTKMGSHRYVYDLLSRIGEAQVEVPGTGCGEELVLSSGTATGTVTHESCGTVRAEGSYAVGASGDVTLRAGKRVVLVDGFSVASGGRLTVGTDPALDPEGEPTDANQSFSYDRFGNLLSVTTDREGQSPETRMIGTNASTNRLTVAGYDLSGNVTSWSGREYRYDPFNMVWQTKPTSGNGHTFVYGPGDERLWTIDWSAGTAVANWVETWTLRDLDGSPLRQYRSTGGNVSGAWSLQRDYVYRSGGLLAAHTPAGLQHFHLDHLGSPRILTDSNGGTLAQHLYFPFGEEATDPGQNAEALKFTGHERDDLDASGTTRDLDYMHRRFHSPHLGRFFSPDELKRYEPLRTPQLYNRYSYVVGNPVNLVDPDGLRPLRATELQFFNAIFGADFSTVDVRGGLLGRAVTAVAGAQGVTLGENVFLSPDGSQGFDQGLRRSVALVGHELTHVLQYRHLGGQRFLDGYLQNYAFNRSSGQTHSEAYQDIVVEEVARKVQGVIFDFLSQNPDIEAKLESGEAFSASEIELISSALQQAIDEGKLLEQGFQIIQGMLVRVEYVPK